MWSLHPPSRSWARADLRNDDQHAPNDDKRNSALTNQHKQLHVNVKKNWDLLAYNTEICMHKNMKTDDEPWTPLEGQQTVSGNRLQISANLIST